MEDMEQCPFCDFALINENPAEKLFCCQNPDCLRESCRSVGLVRLASFKLKVVMRARAGVFCWILN